MISMLKRPRVYVLLALLGLGAAANPPVVPTHVATTSIPALMVYRSPTYGYALPLPTAWTRVPAVRWLPLGPTADLTAMTPDHNAAIGALISPLGNRVASDAYLQTVADRLIVQEDEILSGKIYERRVVIHGVAYRLALATLDHGGQTQASSWMLVLVTAQHRRLYAFAGLVYDREFYFPDNPSSGSDTTPSQPTDTPIALPFAAPAHGSAAQLAPPLAATTPAAGDGGVASRPARPLTGQGVPSAVEPATAAGSRSARRVSPAVVAASEHGNPARCPEVPRDIFPPVLDKNCALHTEQVTIERSFAGISLDPHAAADPRPAPSIGLDNFAHQRDAAHGFALDYPARWAPYRAPGTTFVVEAPDHKAFVAVDVQPAGTAPYSQAALQTLTDRTLEQLGHVVAPVVHEVRQIGGHAWVVAQSSILFDDQGVGASGDSLAAVTVSRGRLYLLQEWNYITGPGNDDRDVAPRFFAPFYPLARVAAVDYFATERWAAQLEDISANSFTLDPRALIDRRPAPVIGVDNFTRFVSAAHGYSVSYPSQWTPTARAGSRSDLDVGLRDGSVHLRVAVRPASGADADLHTVADRAMAPFLKDGVINHANAYSTVHLNGQTWLEASNDEANTEVLDSQGNGHYINRDVTILVTVRGGRLYIVTGWVRKDINNTELQNIDLIHTSLGTLALV